MLLEASEALVEHRTGKRDPKTADVMSESDREAVAAIQGGLLGHPLLVSFYSNHTSFPPLGIMWMGIFK